MEKKKRQKKKQKNKKTNKKKKQRKKKGAECLPEQKPQDHRQFCQDQ